MTTEPSPFSAPGHQPWQGGPTMVAPPAQVWSAPSAPAPAMPYGQPQDRTALWLGASALVVALLALVAAVIALVVSLGAGAALEDPAAFDLHGEVVGVPAGAMISGERMEHALTAVLTDDGAEVDEISCPDLLSLQASASVSCTGTVDGFDDWTGRVTFTGRGGEFDLREF